MFSLSCHSHSSRVNLPWPGADRSQPPERQPKSVDGPGEQTSGTLELMPLHVDLTMERGPTAAYGRGSLSSFGDSNAIT